MPVHAVADTTEPLKTLAVHLERGIYMHKLSDDERNLLRHYAEDEPFCQRCATITRHLLGIGCIQEQSMSGQDALIAVTDASKSAAS